MCLAFSGSQIAAPLVNQIGSSKTAMVPLILSGSRAARTVVVRARLALNSFTFFRDHRWHESGRRI
jgi:hypothetical protein